MAYTYLDPNTINIIFGSYNIRMVAINGETYFVLSDLAKYLGYRDAYNLTRLLDNPEVACPSNVRDTTGRVQLMTCIPERALDEICLQVKANRPEIEQFRAYVLNIIHQVRNTGLFIPPVIAEGMDGDPQVAQIYVNRTNNYFEKMKILEAKLRASENERRLQMIYSTMSNGLHRLETQYNASIVNVAKGIVGDVSRAIDVGELAKHIWNTDTDIGRNRLFYLLRRDGYIMKTYRQYNIPTQKSLDEGLMFASEVNSPKAMVTPKGLEFFTTLYSGYKFDEEDSQS